MRKSCRFFSLKKRGLGINPLQPGRIAVAFNGIDAGIENAKTGIAEKNPGALGKRSFAGALFPPALEKQRSFFIQRFHLYLYLCERIDDHFAPLPLQAAGRPEQFGNLKSARRSDTKARWI